MTNKHETIEVDVIVVGAGASGLYALHRLRQSGMSVRVLEAAPALGGVWYFNRYPGARCDVESFDYSYSFSEELDQEWSWRDRFATQAEIEQYLNYVADKFDLRRDVTFDTRVAAARYDQTSGRWLIITETGDAYSAQFCIMATGQLSTFNRPEIPGADLFRGAQYDTGLWPHEPVVLDGLRVGVVGTGSSGIQTIPEVAKVAAQVVVFQRTPNFSVPAGHRRISAEEDAALKATYPARRAEVKHSPTGNVVDWNPQPIAEDPDPASRRANFERRLRNGAFTILQAYGDLLTDMDANAVLTEYMQDMIRAKINDPKVADILVPTGYPAASKRLCVDDGYFETFNRDNVRLVDLRETPITEITENGIRIEGDEDDIELDVIIWATGFDGMTGAMTRIDITGRDGLTIGEAWEHGPRAYLGAMIHGFPNLFMIAGPGSPSVLGNVIHSAEQHVNWFDAAFKYMREHGLDTMEPTAEAEAEWLAHVATAADATVFTKVNSWYLGSNIPGKPRVFMIYVGGTNAFRDICDEIAADNYRGFEMTAASSGLAVAG